MSDVKRPATGGTGTGPEEPRRTDPSASRGAGTEASPGTPTEPPASAGEAAVREGRTREGEAHETPEAYKAPETAETREAREAPGAATAARSDDKDRGRTAALLPHDETDKLALRLQQAVTGFVDTPRGSVEEADHVLEEIASRVTDAVARCRRTLRMSWQSTDDEGTSAATDTEQLRLALRDYRELAERLLSV
ncbi:hypothetical protein [Streptomyces sp. NPDC001315]|uniref:hypothetical protein n=1 Tax=Streptomyces sp. NPDC001315 TaxID=3364562 RepID=UPI00368476E6